MKITIVFSTLLLLIDAYPQNLTRKADVKKTNAPAILSKFPTVLSNTVLVNHLISTVSAPQVKQYLTDLTLFPNRYFNSKEGVEASEWIYNSVVDLQSLIKEGDDVLLTVKFFNHTDFLQPSVIARYESKKRASNPKYNEIVIAGSHFDTISRDSPDGPGGANPAADDCASGSTVVFTTLRTLVMNRFVPRRPIEMHWYAAEEEGLYGSKEIAADYSKRKVSVLNYLNLDQSGYVAPNSTPKIGIMTDFTTANATNFARLAVAKYVSVKDGAVIDTKCGYACSDHASWYLEGYNSALIFESDMEGATPYNDRVNTDGSPLDTLDTIDWTHLGEFIKSTLGFLVELSLAA